VVGQLRNRLETPQTVNIDAFNPLVPPDIERVCMRLGVFVVNDLCDPFKQAQDVFYGHFSVKMKRVGDAMFDGQFDGHN
jgi:hypothetical protein